MQASATFPANAVFLKHSDLRTDEPGNQSLTWWHVLRKPRAPHGALFRSRCSRYPALAECWSGWRAKRLPLGTFPRCDRRKRAQAAPRRASAPPGRGARARVAEEPPEKRWDFRLPSLRDAPLVPPLGRAAREERAEERERQRQMASVEAADRPFFGHPPAKRVLAYSVDTSFPVRTGARRTRANGLPGLTRLARPRDQRPVDILNSVSVEGWKLVTGKFIYSEMRNGVIGCLPLQAFAEAVTSMNNPWQDHGRLA